MPLYDEIDCNRCDGTGRGNLYAWGFAKCGACDGTGKTIVRTEPKASPLSAEEMARLIVVRHKLVDEHWLGRERNRLEFHKWLVRNGKLKGDTAPYKASEEVA